MSNVILETRGLTKEFNVFTAVEFARSPQPARHVFARTSRPAGLRAAQDRRTALWAQARTGTGHHPRPGTRMCLPRACSEWACSAVCCPVRACVALACV